MTPLRVHATTHFAPRAALHPWSASPLQAGAATYQEGAERNLTDAVAASRDSRRAPPPFALDLRELGADDGISDSVAPCSHAPGRSVRGRIIPACSRTLRHHTHASGAAQVSWAILGQAAHHRSRSPPPCKRKTNHSRLTHATATVVLLKLYDTGAHRCDWCDAEFLGRSLGWARHPSV
jgi:hypothetical protein